VRRLGPALAAALAAGCARLPAALSPAGPQADRIGRLWWVIFWITVAVYVVVIAVLAWALARRRRAADDAADDPGSQHALTRAVSAGVVVTVLALVGVLTASARTGHSLASRARQNALSIRVVGHQWWWEVDYEDSSPSQTFTTANEIHVPVGQPVRLTLTSSDVIHSFWVPTVNGKRDLFPGRLTELMIEVDRPGTYEGRCAEFCGLQHAHMALLLVAEPLDRFDEWRKSQRRPAPEPSNPEAIHGREVFLAGPCVLCHQVRGTEAGGTVGPDLTHVGSRMTLAAGTIPNSRGHLAGWILDPQQIKPGNKMPANSLDPSDLQALVSYLQGLH
jgi:cytochrome c oxidase subunit 2